jgi:secreted trypsin-like serine protease
MPSSLTSRSVTHSNRSVRSNRRPSTIDSAEPSSFWASMPSDDRLTRMSIHSNLSDQSEHSTRAWVNNSSTETNSPPISRIVNGTPTNLYASVGKVGSSIDGWGCSGTLIGSRYVLTAGHCAEGLGNTQGRFFANGQSYSTSRVFVHPQYNSNTLANDIAIFELNRDVAGVAPSEIFRGTPKVGQLLTLVGFGAGGNGDSGHNGDYGIKRVGTTPIDGVESKLITWEFDNNSESNTAPGDSGGAAFVSVNGTQYLAGVTSGGSNEDAGIGDSSFDTRVDAFQNWIDSIVTGTPGNSDDHGNTFSASTLVKLSSQNRLNFDARAETGDDFDMFRFKANSGGNLFIRANRLSGNIDTMLTVYDKNQNVIVSNDDFGGSLNARVVFKAKLGEEYFVRLGTYDDTKGNYRLVFSPDDARRRFKRSSGNEQLSARTPNLSLESLSSRDLNSQSPRLDLSLAAGRNSIGSGFHTNRGVLPGANANGEVACVAGQFDDRLSPTAHAATRSMGQSFFGSGVN